MEIFIPRATITASESGERLMVLECACGYAMPYPGTNAAPPAITCERCGTTWRAVEPVLLFDRFGVRMPS